MTSLAAGIVDPTKVGKYRVVLSDALLGKDPKELYTGVRYNHKPALSSSTAPHQARIKPTDSTASSTSYDLSFQDDGGRYTYQGTRGHEENQYVLIFDPEREVFVLHRVDSMFNMNLVRTPNNQDAEDLRQEHPQLEAHLPSRPLKKTNNTVSAKPVKAPKGRKPAPKETKSSISKTSEPPKPSRPAKPKKLHQDSEDESSDDDLLTIEDPGGAAPTPNRDFSPGFIDKPRRFSDFVRDRDEEEDDEDNDENDLIEGLNDADGEEEEEGISDDDASENFKLPSPIHRQMMRPNINGGGGHSSVDNTAYNAQEDELISDADDPDEEIEYVGVGGVSVSQDDPEDDLEALLEAELAEDDDGEESDVSEEE